MCLAVLTMSTGVAYAAFVSTSLNPTTSFAAAPDWTAPTVNRSTAAGTAAGTFAQHISPGLGYYLYADLTDTGNPASGISTVTTDAGSLTTGQAAAPMTAGAYTFAGVNYNYRTSLLTANANATLSACSYLPTITIADVAGNTATTAVNAVMVDRNMVTDYNVRLDGATAADEVYGVQNAGDVNGDGKPDAIVGAWGADNNGRSFSGSAYVVFGQTALTTIDLATLGTKGFRIDGLAANDETAVSVWTAGGDLNADGKADLLIGADYSDPGGLLQAGTVYVVFGKATTTNIDLAALGAGGYSITGQAANNYAGERIASIPDLNGDGKPETLLSARGADNNGRTDSGSAYVVFGKATTTAVDLNALGAAGYRIDGAAAGDVLENVNSIGDLNGDGKPEVLIGTDNAGANGRVNSGSAFVVWGKSTTTTIDLAALGSQGYRIDGAAAGDLTGQAVVPAGDLNGDAKPDLMVTAFSAGNNGRALSGSTYVLWGKSTTTTIDLASLGAQGYRIDGSAANEKFGYDAVSISDINSDGLPDTVISAARADNNGLTDSGSVYVLWGRSTTTTIDLAALGTQGYRIDGTLAGELMGWKIAMAGDVNADGRPDLLIAGKDTGNNGRATSGSAYIAYTPTCT